MVYVPTRQRQNDLHQNGIPPAAPFLPPKPVQQQQFNNHMNTNSYSQNTTQISTQNLIPCGSSIDYPSSQHPPLAQYRSSQAFSQSEEGKLNVTGELMNTSI
jgi:hypothetical protein